MVGRQYRRLNFFRVLLFSYFALSVAVKCEWEDLGASGDYTTASDKVALAGLTFSECMTACAESTTCAVIHFCDVLSGSRYGECYMSSTVSSSPSAAGCSQVKNFKPKHGLTSCASCDASDPPKNGFIGNCTNSLARGSSCQPTCSSGFQPSGSSFCSSSGILSSAVCTETIDVNGRQMQKDSDGWILLLAYKHVGGENVVLVPGTVPTSPTEGYSHVWLDDRGLSTDNVNAVKFFCTSSVHSRVLHFSMNSAWIKSAISDGSASGNIAAQWTSGVTELVGHSASLPGTTNAVFTEDLMKFPFYYNDSPNSRLFGIRAYGHRFACDDYPTFADDRSGYQNDNLFQIWFKPSSLCSVNEYVSMNVCRACPAGTTNAANDVPVGSDTTCDATLCGVNEFVSSNVCTACPAGTTNAADDDASGSDTTCHASACSASSVSTKDGSDGTFYCINGGTAGGTTGSCTCTGCDAGYSGANCQVADACTVSTTSSKDGSDGTFYCINGGTAWRHHRVVHLHFM
jgi:hypothetical protein